MLVLTRKFKQGIICELPGGEEIRVVIERRDGSGFRVGIQAPPHVTIVREELRDKRQEVRE